MKRIFLLIPLIAVLFSFTANAGLYSDGLAGPIILYDDCESDPVASWGTPKHQGWNYFSGGDHNPANQNQSATVKRVTAGQEGAPAPRAGNSSYRMRVIKDTSYPACCNYTRAEMYWGGGNGNEFTGVNWMAVSMYIPDDWCNDNRPVGVAYDMKFADAIGPASFMLKIENNQYQANRQYPQGGTEYRTNIGPVIKGQWVDWVLHRNFKDDNTGFMELYMNKNLVWSYNGPNYRMQSGPTTEGYMLQGIYKWSWASSNGQGEGTGLCNDKIVIYYDEYKFGKDNSSLVGISPGGQTPTTPVGWGPGSQPTDPTDPTPPSSGCTMLE